MGKPYDLKVVSVLIANALSESIGQKELCDGSGVERTYLGSFEAEIVVLTEEHEDYRKFGFGGSFHFTAGFELAMRLCCRVLADPLSVDVEGISEDVAYAKNIIAKWREEQRKTKRVA